MRATVAATFLAGLAGITACASSTDQGPDAPPVLQVTSPQRGATVDGDTLMVTGTATGGAGLTVSVNNTAVPVGKDGSFTASVPATPGISIIETHAHDKAGHDVRDVRAVLAGTLAASDGTHAATIAAHASPAALASIGKAVASDAKAVDYTAIATALNPVYNNGGCLGAVVNITSVSVGNIDVQLVPKAGALATAVTIDNVVVKAHVDFKVACIGGSDTLTVSSSAAHLSGDLGVTVSGGKLVTSLPSASVALDNFNLSVGGIPSSVVGLFEGTVKSKVQTALQNAITSKVPPIANAKLAGLLAKPFDAKLLGVDSKLTVTPKTVTVATSGMLVAVDTKVAVTGGAGGVFLEQPAPDPSMLSSTTKDLGLAIANDVLNQLLAGLWAAGAFDKTVPIASVGPLAGLLDSDATQLKVSISLPPTVQSDGTGNLQLAIGDAMIHVQDASGTDLQTIALSLQTGLAAGPTQSGTLSLALGTPTVYAQVLGQVDDGSRPLTDMQVEGIVTGVWGLVSQQAGDALGKLPMPAIAGVQLGAPTVDAVSNFVVADIPLN
ncbi:MAG: hypothetical protein ACM31C_06635 [Acidobacteriota bacterium]